VTAGGSSVWELAILGVPALGIGRARQETELLHFAAARGIVVDLGFHLGVAPRFVAERLARLLADPAERARLSRTARRAVDGRGPERVLQAMLGNEHLPSAI
jgi:spore coat polysaccharide biosynthesis predicted glycosyltransferase SpsG